MPHTPFLSAILRMAQSAAATRSLKITRRAMVASSAMAVPVLAQGNLPVVVVGAGLAGLTCAYRLAAKGIQADIYDANTRLGGRCWSLRGAFDDNQVIERGGELIDQAHTSIRQLCKELRLPLDNLLAAEPNGTEPFYYIDGSPYTFRDATADVKSIWQKIHSDLSAANYPTTYYQSTARGRELDNMSILDWINESIPGGIYSRLGQLLDIAYNIEYGEETSRQSALNLVYLLGYSGQGQFRVFGQSNEKYHVRGGNDQIVSKLASGMAASRIKLGFALTAIRKNTNGSYELTFREGNSTRLVAASRVILALPFSILRTLDYSQAGFRPVKQTAIAEQGMGANAKLMLQFRSRRWNELGNNGDSYSDSGYQLTWEATRAQAGKSGILVQYSGGDTARAANTTTPATVLSQLEPVFPGISAQWNGKSHLQHWPTNPLTRGSYSFWKPGQYQSFVGSEGEAEGNCHFCGEHTSLDFQGYLNGAVETGERAATEVISAIGK